MATQTLRDTSKNILPVRAARFFLKNGQINPEKEHELFEKHWTIKKVAETLVIEAIEAEPWLTKDLLANNISLDALLTLNEQSLDIIFTQLYPLLEPILLRGLLDPFYDNSDIDPREREERAITLNRLNTALDVPSELISEQGTQTGQAPIFIRRAYQRAEVLKEAIKTEFVIERTIARISGINGGVAVDPALSAYLAKTVLEDPEVNLRASKISSLPEDQTDSALADFERLLAVKLKQETERLSPTISSEKNPSPLIVSLETPTVNEQPTPSRQIAGEVVDNLFKLVTPNDRPVLVDKVEEALDSPVLDLPFLVQDQPFRELFAEVAIETVTGKTTIIPPDQLPNLVGHLSELLATPNENTAKTISLVVSDAIPNLNPQQRENIVKYSTNQLDQITLAQSLIQPTPVGMQPAQIATLSPDVLAAIGKQTETALKVQLTAASVTNIVSPQFAQTVLSVIPEVTTGTASKTDAVAQIASTLNRSTIDNRKAEEIVMTFGRFTEGLDPHNYQHSLSIWRDNAMLAVAATGLNLKPDEITRIVDILVPVLPSPALPPLQPPPTALSEPPIIYISPKLGSLLKQLPPTPRPSPAVFASQPVLSFKQLLLDRAARQLSGLELIEVSREINLLFAKPNPQLIAELDSYLFLPEDQRGTIAGVRVGKHTAIAPQVYIRQSGREPDKGRFSMAEILAKTPGLSKKLNQLQEIRSVVYRFGTDSKIGVFVRAQVTRGQTLFLMSRGVNEEDLTRTQNYLLQRGRTKRNVEAVRELQDVQSEMTRIRRENPRFFKLIDRLRGVREGQLKSGHASPIHTPFSRFETVIKERSLYNPRLWQVRQERLLQRIFGKGDIIVRGRTMQVNRLRYFQFKLNRLVYSQISRFRVGRAYLRFSRRLSQQGFEKLLKTKAQALGQATIKKLAGTAAGKAAGRTAARFAASAVGKGLTKVLSSVLVKLGITTLAGVATGGIGFIVAAALEISAKVFKKIFNTSKKLFSAIGGFTQSLLLGLANSDDIQIMSDRTKNIMIASAVGFTVIFLPVILIGNIISGVFLQNPYDQLAAEFDGTGEIAEGCFIFSGDWTTEDKALANGALAKILSFKKYADVLCEDDKKIGLVRKNSSDWCSAGSGFITVTDRCLGTADNTLYSLAHESGHIYYQRSPETYASFGINVCGANGPTEGYICSYPIPPLSCGEDFPETIAVYIMNQFNKSYTFLGGCKKAIDLEKDYWTHYNFIYKYF